MEAFPPLLFVFFCLKNGSFIGPDVVPVGNGYRLVMALPIPYPWFLALPMSDPWPPWVNRVTWDGLFPRESRPEGHILLSWLASLELSGFRLRVLHDTPLECFSAQEGRHRAWPTHAFRPSLVTRAKKTSAKFIDLTGSRIHDLCASSIPPGPKKIRQGNDSPYGPASPEGAPAAGTRFGRRWQWPPVSVVGLIWGGGGDASVEVAVAGRSRDT